MSEFKIKNFEARYSERLLGFILQKIENSKDAEEIYQDTLISAYYSFPAFSRKSSLFTWICAIAGHEIADFYRKRKLKTILFSAFPFLENLASRALSPETVYEEVELKRKIISVFKSLSEGYCQILRLKYIDGFSVVQIAAKLNKTEKAVEMRLRRARCAFINLYKDEKKLKKIDPNFNPRDILIVAQYLGLAVSSVQDPESNRD
ncbi:MAG: RNA polymerase sigma factor [Patescibacteria group bacterium]